jgi:DNA modification methylase
MPKLPTKIPVKGKLSAPAARDLARSKEFVDKFTSTEYKLIDTFPKPFWQTTDGRTVRLYLGDVLARLHEMPAKSVHMCVTSPPYWGLRDYGTAEWEGGLEDCDHISRQVGRGKSTLTSGGIGQTDEGAAYKAQTRQYAHTCGKCGAKRIDQQLGSEKTPEEFVQNMVEVFREVRRILRDDGTLWLNLGDTYGGGNGGNATNSAKQQSNQGTMIQPRAGNNPGNLTGIPWRVALALQADGWILRQDIIWHKPSPMPESVKNRCTKAHEYIFLFSKKQGYYYDAEAIKGNSSEASIARMAAGYNQRDRAINSPPQVNHLSQNMDVTDRSIAGLVESGKCNKRSVWQVGHERTLLEWMQDNAPQTLAEFLGQTQTKPDVWRVSSSGYAGAHFAVYPPKLIEPCILAGTSEKGCCADCGSPYKRLSETEGIATRPDLSSKYGNPEADIRGGSPTIRNRVINSTKTLGWEKPCKCNTDAILPCLVLDPFMGSGTTAAVCIDNGRHAIGIDLSEAYLREQAIPRIEGELLARPALRHLTGRIVKRLDTGGIDLI